MFSKTIKYTDFNNQEQEKVFWFHLSNAKLAMLSADDSLKSWVDKMAKSTDNFEILDKIRFLVKLACGVRSEDGQRFIQNEEAQSELLDSPAYDVLLFELFVGDNASVFFNALVPEVQRKQIEELAKSQAIEPSGKVEDPRPAYQKENRRPTSAELQRMDTKEMQEAFAWTERNGK
jgi:hypothetical protein